MFLEPILGRREIDQWKTTLGSMGLGSIATEWEIAMAFCISHTGAVSRPTTTAPERTSPDFVWKSRDTGEKLLVEVSSISDSHAQGQNPVEQFLSELNRVALKHGIDKHGGLHCQIGHVEQESAAVLAIPSLTEMSTFFRSAELLAFLQGIRQKPSEQASYSFSRRGAATRITFTPGKATLGAGHREFRTLVSLTANPIAKRIDRKATQVRRSGLGLPAVLFLCDNDCRALWTSMRGPDERSVVEVIDAALAGYMTMRTDKTTGRARQVRKGGTTQINGVLLLAVSQAFSAEHGITCLVEPRYIENRRRVRHSVSEETLDSLMRSLGQLPRPVRTPANALRLRSARRDAI